MRFLDKSLYARLKHLSNSDVYPFHMPGHKRNMDGYPLDDLYKLDITELDDFDNLHEPEGIIKNIQDNIKRIYHTEDSFLLINGSSCGVLSAISACTERRSMIMLARNSHKSAYHAVYQEELAAIYLYPEYNEEAGLYGCIPSWQVERMLQNNPECKTVFITSPTYEGIISDIRSIADLVHRYGGVLIVDEAHGAHLRYSGQEEKSAVFMGADIVIHSIHKTLPAPTQTALLHVCSKRVPVGALRRYLRIYQSSSPSYVLMAGIEECYRILESEGAERCLRFRDFYSKFRKEMEELKSIQLFPQPAEGGGVAAIDRYAFNRMNYHDLGKLVISVKGTQMSGKELYQTLLHEFHLQMEMATGTYVLAVLTLMDTEDSFKRLGDALLAIDRRLQERQQYKTISCQSEDRAVQIPISGVTALQEEGASVTIRQAFGAERAKKPLIECEGRIAAEFITPYPPGIPLIVPGEPYTGRLIRDIIFCLEKGLTVHGVMGNNQVYVLDDCHGII